MSKLSVSGKILRWLSLLWLGLALIRIGLGLTGWLTKEDVVLGSLAFVIAALTYRVGHKLEGKR